MGVVREIIQVGDPQGSIQCRCCPDEQPAHPRPAGTAVTDRAEATGPDKLGERELVPVSRPKSRALAASTDVY